MKISQLKFTGAGVRMLQNFDYALNKKLNTYQDDSPSHFSLNISQFWTKKKKTYGFHKRLKTLRIGEMLLWHEIFFCYFRKENLL